MGKTDISWVRKGVEESANLSKREQQEKARRTHTSLDAKEIVNKKGLLKYVTCY